MHPSLEDDINIQFTEDEVQDLVLVISSIREVFKNNADILGPDRAYGQAAALKPLYDKLVKVWKEICDKKQRK